jgi:hypothetical protein
MLHRAMASGIRGARPSRRAHRRLGQPDLPVKVLRGSLEGSDYINFAALDAMHRRVYAGG